MIGCRGTRGQVNFDFAVGVSILVVTIVIAFSFIPGVFGGVTEGQQQSDKVVADRIAQWLVTEGLADGGDRTNLDLHCTNSFFTAPSKMSYCGFTSGDIREDFPVGQDRFVHVSIVHDGTIQCWSGTDWQHGHVTDASPPPASPPPACIGEYTAGNSPQDSQEISVARRAATLGDRNVVIIVEVW